MNARRYPMRAVLQAGAYQSYGSWPFLGARLECGHLKVLRGLRYLDPKVGVRWFKPPKRSGCPDCGMGLKASPERYYLVWKAPEGGKA